MCIGWVGLDWGDFLTQPTMVGQKNLTQPNPSHKSNPTHMGWVGSNWTHELDNFFITIIIKLSRKNISHSPPELINKIYINI